MIGFKFDHLNITLKSHKSTFISFLWFYSMWPIRLESHGLNVRNLQY